MNPVLSMSEFADAMQEPNWADVHDVQWVAVAGAPPAGAQEWVRRQAIPVVGIGDQAEPWDICVKSRRSLATLVDHIEANPRATAVLVQLLRTSVEMPIASALAMESLAYATLQGGDEHAAWLRKQPMRRLGEAVVDPVLLSRSGACLEVKLNMADRRNALCVQLRDALTETFKLVLMDDSISSVEVWGEGPCFSSGGDLAEFSARADVTEAHAIRSLRMPAQYLAQCAQRCHFRLHGACIGAGIELPAFAGRVSAHPDAEFRLPEIGMGLIPGAGGCVSIPRRIGRQRTAWLAITGQTIGTDEALRWGLIDEVWQ